MSKICRGAMQGLAAVAVAALLAWPVTALAEQPIIAPHSTIPAGQTFSCGAGFTFLSVGVSGHGNISRFESPAGKEHYFAGDPRSGYQVCYSGNAAFVPRFDFGSTEGGLGAAVTVQPSGPGTFPLEITRTTSDGQITITRRITGNSFVAAGGLFDLNGDGVSCSTLAECGNCTNRTVHVVTRVKNNTIVSKTVGIVELVDVDIAGGSGTERGLQTADSVTLMQDEDDAGTNPYGLLLQSLITLPSSGSGIWPYGGYFETASSGPPFDCLASVTDLPKLATPTTAGDREMVLMQFVTVPAGATNTGSVRIHHRRY
jgi:hypothetical protein